MNTSIWRRGLQLGLVAGLMLAAAAKAAEVDPDFARAQRENAQQLRRYTWKSRIEVRKGGETKSVQLNLMRYDSNGMLQKTPMSNTPAPQLPTRGLRGRIAGKKKNDFVETIGSLGALAKSYAELSPEKLQRFTSDFDAQRQLLRLKASDVLQPGDSMSIWLDATTRKPRKVEIQTTFERKPVSISADFRDLAEGPTYVARSLLNYPEDELTLITENFDYLRALE